jgi:hypothetical protein
MESKKYQNELQFACIECNLAIISLFKSYNDGFQDMIQCVN